MLTSTEYEWEALPESEWEMEGEGECESELESEYESEEFFRRLGGLARRALRSPALRRLGLQAARRALGGLGGLGATLGRRLGPGGEDLGRTLGTALGGFGQSRLPQSEFEFEEEMEWEAEAEANPIRRVYPNALMEHLGHAATAAESEAEAEAFLGALIPLAGRLLPQAAPTLMRAAPGLIRGIAGVGRMLRSRAATRPLVRALPTIVKRTAASVARRQRQGRPVTPQGAVRTLAQQTARLLSSPQQITRTYRRSRSADRRYHATAPDQRRCAAAVGTTCPTCSSPLG